MDKINWKTDQLAPLDVLNFLDDIFEIKSKTKYNLKVYGANNNKDKKLIRNNTITDNNFIINIDMDQMKKTELLLKTIYPKFIDNAKFDSNNLWQPSSSSTSYKQKKYY